MENMKRDKYIYRILLLLATWTAVSCSQEDGPMNSEPVADAVEFTGATKSGNPQTRAGEEEEIWLDMPFDTWKWDGTPIDFYIHQQVTEGTSPNLSIYNLKQGETGRLIPKTDGTDLKWVSNNARHTFHSWTQPAGVTMATGKKTQEGTVDILANNLDYEYFVGTTEGPMDYGTHGVTVGLNFKHLVSKIVIDRITLVRSDGSTNSNVWKDVRSIIFPNMPIKGTFTTGVAEGQNMEVNHSTIPEDRGATFKFSDYTDYFNENNAVAFYIFPQQFNDANDYGKFYVSLNHGDDIRMYEGSLKDLVNENDPDQPLTGINAGECLTVRLVLTDEKVEGFYVYIENWNTAEPGTVSDKPYQGIGSAGEIEHNVEDKGNNRFEFKKDFLDELVYEEQDGKKVVRLTDNIDLSQYSNIKLVIPDGYILDGCNFNIDCPGLTLEGNYKNVYINGVLPNS